MITADTNSLPSYSRAEDGALDHSRALLNILEDSAAEKGQFRDIQSAVLNILEDSNSEQEHLHDAETAMLNILEDFGEEKSRLEATESAVLNILDDFVEEKTRLEGMKRAVLNILDDLAFEKSRLEETQMEALKSEQTARASLREKETLLKEVHHRVKNNLQVIASLLRLQSRYLSDEQARRMFEESQSRVHSISLVHEMLYQASDLARIDFADYLRNLTESLMSAWKGAAGLVKVRVEATGVQLTVDKAIPCGLIVNELVTNALKHAFPNARSGVVQISAVRGPADWLRLTVEDNGIGLPANLDLRRSGSLGLELVATLVRQLRAKLEIRREPGTAFEIAFQVAGD